MSTLLIAALLAAPGRAADDELPKAEQIIERHLEATGGRAAYEKLKSRKIVGRLTMTGQPEPARILLLEQAPNKRYLEVDVESLGKQIVASDGDQAWQINERTGASQMLDGEAKAEAVRIAVFLPELRWRKVYKQAETVGVEEIDERPAYKVKLVAEGSTVANYYDKQTGRLVRTDRTVQSPMGDLVVQAYLGEYKQFGDLMIPVKQRQVAPAVNLERVFEIESVEYDVEIPSERFQPPSRARPSTRPTASAPASAPAPATQSDD